MERPRLLLTIPQLLLMLLVQWLSLPLLLLSLLLRRRLSAHRSVDSWTTHSPWSLQLLRLLLVLLLLVRRRRYVMVLLLLAMAWPFLVELIWKRAGNVGTLRPLSL